MCGGINKEGRQRFVTLDVFRGMTPAMGSLLFAITFALFCWWIAWLMDKWILLSAMEYTIPELHL